MMEPWPEECPECGVEHCTCCDSCEGCEHEWIDDNGGENGTR